MISNEVLDKFSEFFSKRLLAHPMENITEDCLRYDLFASFLQKDFNSDQYILEHPHPHANFLNRELDLVHINKENTYQFIIEMKYFKRLPSDKQDTTGYMAKLFIDFLKLYFANLNDARKYFIFATDEVMQTYINNESNGFSDLLSVELGSPIQVSGGMKKGKTKHFNDIVLKDIPASLDPLNKKFIISRKYEKVLPLNHKIYVFDVHG
jgi:hypothetical protein